MRYCNAEVLVFLRLLRLFAAIHFVPPVVYAADFSRCRQTLVPNPQPWKPSPATSVHAPSPGKTSPTGVGAVTRSGWPSGTSSFNPQSAIRNQRKPPSPVNPQLCPIVPNQASIVLKRAKTRYFFAAQPCHDPRTQRGRAVPPLFIPLLQRRDAAATLSRAPKKAAEDRG